MIGLLTILFTALLASTAIAQNTVTVMDSDKEPLIRATIRFRCLDGSCKDSLIVRRTHADGSITVPFAARTSVTIEYVGHQTIHDTLPKGFNRAYYLKRNENDVIVVTGQFSPKSIAESAYNIQVFDRERIENQGATTLRDLMTTELNVRLEQDMILGTGMSIQGISGQNVKILIDGIPVLGRLGGNIDLNQISLANVERVELIRGPLSVIYGTDALGGVVNLITDRRAPAGITGKIQSYGESIGSVNINGDVAYRSGNTRIMASAGRDFFAGYSEFDTSRAKQWKPREQYNATWEAQQWLSDLSFIYSGRHFQEFILNRGEPRLPYRETAFDDKYYTKRTSHNLTFSTAPKLSSLLDGVIGYSIYNRVKNTFFKDLVTLNEQLTANPEDQDTTRITGWTIRSTYSQNDPDSTLSWQSGVDINLESISGRRIENTVQRLGDYAVFTSAQYQPVSGVTIQPSLRYAYNTNYGAPLIPSLNLHFLPDQALTLRMSYARGFRAPSLKDLYFYFVDISHNIRGNTDLRAEYSHSFNADIKWYPLSIPSDLTFSVALFHNTIKDLITLAFVEGDLYSYVNVGQHQTVGGTFEIGHKRPDIETNVGISLTGKRNHLLETDATTPYSIATELRGDIQWLLPVIDTRLSAFYKYTGPQPSFMMDANNKLQESTTESYHIVDLSLIKQIEGMGITFSAGVKNLLDVRSIRTNVISTGRAHSSGHGGSIPLSWGRTAFLDLKLTLGQ